MYCKNIFIRSELVIILYMLIIQTNENSVLYTYHVIDIYTTRVCQIISVNVHNDHKWQTTIESKISDAQ